MSQDQGQQAPQSGSNVPESSTQNNVQTPVDSSQNSVQNPELTARFTQLSKKEAAIVKERQAFKKQQEEFQTKYKQVEEVNKKVQEFENLKKSNALEAIKYLGFTDTDIFNALASVPEPTPEDKMKKVVQEELTAYQKMQADKAASVQAEQDKKVIGDYKANIMNTITTDAAKYEFCNFHGEAAKEQVYELIETEFKNSGEIIPMKEALDIVEQFYEESAQEMTKLSKLRMKATPETPETKTLTPQVSPRPTNSVHKQPNAPSTESREAKRARLIGLIKQGGFKR